MNKYKILIVKNRYTKPLKIQKYLDWFALNTPIEIISEEISTDFDVTTKQVGNATYHGVVCGDDIITKVKTVVPEGKYNCVVFIYGNELNGIRVSTATGSFYKDTEFIQTFKGDDDGRVTNHELFHAFFYKAHKLQINIIDPMDTYLRDSDLKIDNNINTNREIALQKLAPYWSQICTFRKETKPIVNINRFSDDGVETLGDLTYGNFHCKTLEPSWRLNQKNISCIPKGTYEVKKVYSLKFGLVYEVQNVPNRTGIYFHGGNFFFNTKGCILLGKGYGNLNNDKETDITDTKATRKTFEILLNFKPFTLKID